MVNDSPGLKQRKLSDGGFSSYWVASNVSKDIADYPLKTVRLHGTDDEISQRCRVLTSELKQWLSDRGKGPQPIFDGTVKSLIAVYRKTEESPYHNVKHNTRHMYDQSLDLLEKTVGARQLKKLTGLDFTRWYNNLKEPAKVGEPERQRRSYKAMQLLRIIVKFGVVANIPECVRLATILQNMEFSAPASRTQHITFAQVEAICAAAIARGKLSIAIAQALQFELTLRQIDVIGIWEPLDNPEKHTGIIKRGQRWTGGVTWSHIDSNGILTKVTTKTGQLAEHDTKAYPFLRKLLDMVPVEKRIGPIVISENTRFPYRHKQFSEIWRQIADDCGVPKDVWNRDSRAGGVTEGSDAGANIEHLRHHANHSNIATTIRYDRKTVQKTRTVAELRVAHRSDPKS